MENDIANQEPNLEDNIKNLIDNMVLDYKDNLFNCIEKCKSPIEKLLALGFFKTGLYEYTNNGIEILDIESQPLIKCNEKRYYPDFKIVVSYDNYKYLHYFIVECDGYEFHQKNKTLVQNDYRRERDLLNNGYTIIRFTGSEIFNNPFKCAYEVKNLILNYIKNNKEE